LEVTLTLFKAITPPGAQGILAFLQNYKPKAVLLSTAWYFSTAGNCGKKRPLPCSDKNGREFAPTQNGLLLSECPALLLDARPGTDF
jgi:hypothetical protein